MLVSGDDERKLRLWPTIKQLFLRRAQLRLESEECFGPTVSEASWTDASGRCIHCLRGSSFLLLLCAISIWFARTACQKGGKAQCDQISFSKSVMRRPCIQSSPVAWARSLLVAGDCEADLQLIRWQLGMRRLKFELTQGRINPAPGGLIAGAFTGISMSTGHSTDLPVEPVGLPTSAFSDAAGIDALQGDFRLLRCGPLTVRKTLVFFPWLLGTFPRGYDVVLDVVVLAQNRDVPHCFAPRPLFHGTAFPIIMGDSKRLVSDCQGNPGFTRMRRT